MTKERELLRRALRYVGASMNDFAEDLYDEIVDHLAAEEGKQEEEPVACSVDASEAYHAVDKFLRNNLDDEDYSLLSNALETVFLHPSPQAEQRKALSEGEIDQELLGNDYYSRSFTAGVRWAERMHKIGGGDE